MHQLSYERSCFLGDCISCIESGWFTSVVVHGDLIYAAAYNIVTANKIYVLRHTDQLPKPWERIHRFSVMRGNITLRVRKDQIMVCSAAKNRIAVYSMNGELECTYGKKGYSSSGHVYDPIICNDDDDGSVLIADRYNNRLQVMSPCRVFSIVMLEPSVQWPVGAALYENSLFVTSSAAKIIYKYEEKT